MQLKGLEQCSEIFVILNVVITVLDYNLRTLSLLGCGLPTIALSAGAPRGTAMTALRNEERLGLDLWQTKLKFPVSTFCYICLEKMSPGNVSKMMI